MISGTYGAGNVLTDLPPVTWSPATTTVAYQWLVCSGSPLTCAAATGAGNNTASYTMAAADLGLAIEVQEAAIDAASPVPNTATATSAPLNPAPPSNTGPPTISGTDAPGNDLSAANGTWTNNPLSYSYRWLSCTGSPLTCANATGTGAATQTYTVATGDAGHAIEVTVTASNAGGSSPAAASAPLLPAPPANTAAPTISGNVALGQPLTASPGTWTNGPYAYAYQWERCAGSPLACSPISGATGTSYTLTGSDVGATIAVQEVAGNAGGSGSPAQSAQTATVTTPSSISVIPSLGDLVADQRVTFIATVTTGTTRVPASGSLSFMDDGAAIPGCTNLAVRPSGQSATVICQASFVASTAHVTAVFSPAPGSLSTASTSSVTTLVVGRATTRISLGVSGSSTPRGTLTLTAKLTPPPGSAGAINPSGVVRFADGDKAIGGCSRRRVTGARATCTVRYSDIGAHHIVVSYGGDANFNATQSPAKLLTIRPMSPTGFVTSLMGWTFQYHPAYTNIGQLVVTGLSPRTTISIVCDGRGCPFHARTVRATTPNSIDLTPLFHGARLRVGAAVTVRISHPDWLGKYYRFLIVAGQRPRITESCLAVDSSRPGMGCAA